MTAAVGTKHACDPAMRAFIAFVVLTGCVGGGGGAGSKGQSSRPAVMPLLSELPADPDKRNAILDSSNTIAGPEQRKSMTVKERKAETAAATAAAIIGSMFSSTPSVTLGTASQFDEVQLIIPTPVPSSDGDGNKADTGKATDPGKPGADPAKPAPPPEPIPSNQDLVPWIKLK